MFTLMMFLLFFKILLLTLFSLLSVALVTLLERKILGFSGNRLGPNKVSFMGLLQPISDATKLFNKQLNSLSNFSFMFYYFCSFLMLLGSFFLWNCSFSSPTPISFKFSVVLLMVILSLNSLCSILLGWSTFSKYSLIGSLRSVSQLISYESVLYFCLFFFTYFYSSFNLFMIKFLPFSFVMFICPFIMFIWIPSLLAELNRTPYDFSEGESELVSGFNTEFGCSSFTFIFLSEYSNILFFCLLSSFLFFFFLFEGFFFVLLFSIIWIRSVMPRFRFDKLMFLAWKFLIPFITIFFIMFLVYSF